jgi:hypothetical protein
MRRKLDGGVSMLVAAALAAPVTGQLAKGTEAPEFQFDKVWNGGPDTFADLKGRVILLEFFATW